MLLYLLVISFLVTTSYLLRVVLLISGVYKDPILKRFEKYGDTEDFFRPLPPLLGSIGLFIIMLTLLLTALWGVRYPFIPMGIMLLGAAYLTQRYPILSGKHQEFVLGYPHWLYDLRERTTRSERRRLAYMWLRLPWKLRVIYNSNDRAFLEWADMVILSTLI